MNKYEILKRYLEPYDLNAEYLISEEIDLKKLIDVIDELDFKNIKKAAWRDFYDYFGKSINGKYWTSNSGHASIEVNGENVCADYTWSGNLDFDGKIEAKKFLEWELCSTWIYEKMKK